MNRAADITLASVALLVAAPVMLATGLAVRALDGSPVLFRQQRIGRHGRVFEILKFRTMSSSGVLNHFDAGNRARVTRLGGLLRRSKLDELPQLLNVIRGDMSLVGPRPEVAAYVDLADDRWREVLGRRPGITDWASIEHFDEESLLAASDDPQRTYREHVLPRKIELQLRYVRNPSLSADATILWRTLCRAASRG